MARLKCRSSARYQLDNQHHQRKHQENVNESAEGVAAHEAKQPQNQEDHKDCPEHFLYLPQLLPISTTEALTPWSDTRVVRGEKNRQINPAPESVQEHPFMR